MTIDLDPRRHRVTALLRLLDWKTVALAVAAAGLVVAVAAIRDAAPRSSTVTIGFASDVQYAELEPVQALLVQRVNSDAFVEEMKTAGHAVEQLDFVATESFEPLAWFDLTVKGDNPLEVEAAAADGGAALIDWVNIERERRGVSGQARPTVGLLSGPTSASDQQVIGWTIASAGVVGLTVLLLAAARRTHMLPIASQADVPPLIRSFGLSVSGLGGNWADDVLERLRSLTSNPPRAVVICGDASAAGAVRSLAAGSAELASRVIPAESAPLVMGGYAAILAVSEGVSAGELEKQAADAQLEGLNLACIVWVPMIAQ